MVREIRLYIEGGGNSDSRKELRKGFSSFFRDLKAQAENARVSFSLILCGSKNSTYEDFTKALSDHPHAFVALLVDADRPVTQSPWEDLNWDSCGTSDDHCHLMVQAMEAWFVADSAKLKDFYGRGFNDGPIPKDTDVERIEKRILKPCLNKATRKTSRKRYSETDHAPKLLALIDAAIVRRASRHCDRLFTTLAQQMGETI